MSSRPVQPFPWRETMAFGLGRLRLSPRQFWAMTPRELNAALEGVHGLATHAPLQRHDLQVLMARFPDEDTL